MVTLDRLVNLLGGYGVRLHFCSVPRSTELRTVVMHENVNGRVVLGDVLMAIGAHSVDEAVQWATEARAVAVLMRNDEDSAFIGEGEPIALMVIDPAVSWSELAAIIHGLVLEGRETESGRGPTDLFALADSLADAVGGAVMIEDRVARMLAYSRLQQHTDPARVETILDRQAPERLRALFDARGVSRHLAESDEPLFVAADAELGMTGRMVVAARAGREILGTVWVACAAPLNGHRLAALTDGARTVALHLLRSRASADLERQVESELVIRLLEGAADAATLASRLGLPQHSLRVIAVRAHLGTERHAPLLLVFEWATTGFGWSRPGRSALSGTTVYTVLPGEEPAAAQRWVSDLRTALPLRTSVVAGISGVAAVAELAAARQEADECLALCEVRRSGDEATPVYDQSWDDILLQRLRTAAGSGRTQTRGPVTELRRHDQDHASHYLATLRAWLEEQGDPVAAGIRLGVHENTVRYRLRKMAEVTDLGLHDARARLAMMIEIAATDEA